MNKIDSIDIDDNIDYQLAKILLENKQVLKQEDLFNYYEVFEMRILQFINKNANEFYSINEKYS